VFIDDVDGCTSCHTYMHACPWDSTVC
jgi:hypothetical protein